MTGTILEMLAAEHGCSNADLEAAGVRVCVRPDERPRLARRYPWRGAGFNAVSLGRGAVICASAALHAEVVDIFKACDRDRVFEPARLAAVSALLASHGLQAVGPYPRLVCGAASWRARSAPPDFALALESEPSERRLAELGQARWPHCNLGRAPDRPTRWLAVAERGSARLGVATLSADSERVWQVGLDVAPDARGLGLGAALTSALARSALDAGKVALYGAAPANLPSLGSALAAGFRLGWVEAFSYPQALLAGR